MFNFVLNVFIPYCYKLIYFIIIISLKRFRRHYFVNFDNNFLRFLNIYFYPYSSFKKYIICNIYYIVYYMLL